MKSPRSEAGAPARTAHRKRVGRGIGGKGGKTAGRGTKGQKARDTVAVGFEGGQMPLHMRVPKLKGFNNPFRVEYQGINLDVLERDRPRRGHARGRSTSAASPTRAPSSRCSAGARSAAPSR